MKKPSSELGKLIHQTDRVIVVDSSTQTELSLNEKIELSLNEKIEAKVESDTISSFGSSIGFSTPTCPEFQTSEMKSRLRARESLKSGRSEVHFDNSKV